MQYFKRNIKADGLTIKTALILVITVLSFQSASAQQEIIWRGGSQSVNWLAQSGWEGVHIPDSTQSVLIKGNHSKGPVVRGKVQVTGLKVERGSALYLAKGGSLIVMPAGSESTDITASVNGIWNSESGSATTLFPNPAADRFTLRIPGGAEELMQVRLFNEAGVEVNMLMEAKTVKAGFSEYTFNISYLKAGVYLVKLQSTVRREVVRLIKIE